MRLITSVDRSDILNSKNGGQFVLWLCGAVLAESCLGCFSSSEFPLQLCSFPPMGGFLPLSYWDSATGVPHIGSSCFAAFSALPLIHKSIYGTRMLGKAGRIWKGSLDCANCTLGIAKHAIVWAWGPYSVCGNRVTGRICRRWERWPQTMLVSSIRKHSTIWGGSHE